METNEFDLALALLSLLDPVSPSDFVEKYFDREPFFLEGRPDKFDFLFQDKDFWSLVDNLSADQLGPKQLRATKNRLSFRSIRPDEVRPMVDQGGTICVTDIHRVHAGLWKFAEAIKHQLSYTGIVGFNCYCSGKESGLDVHFDQRAATTLQISGEKTWKYSNQPGVSYPRQNVIILKNKKPHYFTTGDSGVEEWERAKTPSDAEFREVTLKPGDLLFFPAGTWHAALSSEHSLALNLYFEHTECSTFVERVVREKFLPDEEWRKEFPMQLAQHHSPAKISSEVLQHMESRLKEGATFLKMLSTTPDSLNHIWNQMISDNIRSFIDPKQIHGPKPIITKELEPENRLIVAYRGRHRYSCRKNRWGQFLVSLYFGPKVINFPEEYYSFLARLSKVKSFRAGDCTMWGGDKMEYDWDDMKNILAILIKNYFLQFEKLS